MKKVRITVKVAQDLFTDMDQRRKLEGVSFQEIGERLFGTWARGQFRTEEEAWRGFTPIDRRLGAAFVAFFHKCPGYLREALVRMLLGRISPEDELRFRSRANGGDTGL